MVRFSGYLYPWDLVGDPDAPNRIGALGVDRVVLALDYHAVESATPLHPAHRVVHRSRSGPLDEDFATAAVSLRAADLAVDAWVVVGHRDEGDAGVEDDAHVDAYGSRYSFARCPCAPRTAERIREQAVRAAAAGADGVMFEACGFYGIDHPSDHTKLPLSALTAREREALSICFCRHCRPRLEDAGIDPDALAARVRDADPDEGDALGADRDRLARFRVEAAVRLLGVGADAARAAGVRRVEATAAPDAFAVGMAPALFGPGAPADVLTIPVDAPEAVASAAARAQAIDLPAAIAVFSPVADHDDPRELAARWGRAAEAGAAEIHLYHLGFLRWRGLETVRDAVAIASRD